MDQETLERVEALEQRVKSVTRALRLQQVLFGVLVLVLALGLAPLRGTSLTVRSHGQMAHLGHVPFLKHMQLSIHSNASGPGPSVAIGAGADTSAAYFFGDQEPGSLWHSIYLIAGTQRVLLGLVDGSTSEKLHLEPSGTQYIPPEGLDPGHATPDH